MARSSIQSLFPFPSNVGTAGSAADRSAAAGGRHRCVGRQFAELRPQPGGPQASGGSALEARHELSAHRPGRSAAGGGRCQGRGHGLADDPQPGDGALHPQLYGQEKEGAGLALND